MTAEPRLPSHQALTAEEKESDAPEQSKPNSGLGSVHKDETGLDLDDLNLDDIDVLVSKELVPESLQELFLFHCVILLLSLGSKKIHI